MPYLDYKEFYNKDRGLPEPRWGQKMDNLMCSWCASLYLSASDHPDDPEEIFPYETVRCRNCGHITDWYEAYQLKEKWLDAIYS